MDLPYSLLCLNFQERGKASKQFFPAPFKVWMAKHCPTYPTDLKISNPQKWTVLYQMASMPAFKDQTLFKHLLKKKKVGVLIYNWEANCQSTVSIHSSKRLSKLCLTNLSYCLYRKEIKLQEKYFKGNLDRWSARIQIFFSSLDSPSSAVVNMFWLFYGFPHPSQMLLSS